MSQLTSITDNCQMSTFIQLGAQSL